MSDPNLNWDDVLGEVEKYEADPETKKSNDFEALPAGPYPVVVQDAEKTTAQKSGNDMIKVRVQVSEGPYANRVLFGYIVFSTDNPKAMRITLDKLGAFGVTREFIATQKPSIAQIAEALVGRKAKAVVGIQQSGDYKGSNEVKGFRPLEGVEQAAPQVSAASAPKPAGVPDIPQPEVAAPAATPVIPLPEVPVGAGDAEDPFGD
jgi:hypothetical protein